MFDNSCHKVITKAIIKSSEAPVCVMFPTAVCTFRSGECTFRSAVCTFRSAEYKTEACPDIIMMDIVITL